ncbi:substrate-binding periplasmic protein [Gimibacter soli]|uniref:ABC transporter substrate-binding protein n=1 Tax=Gimibacter soli TaxID=3024400 RepID=A0AAE9XTT9_9PROT|nr:ABC transporter substrate-binding protein [Gimibacter soli]WCL54741.1 ABC transporter substrate-binding protein [Gimibacter soli]
MVALRDFFSRYTYAALALSFFCIAVVPVPASNASSGEPRLQIGLSSKAAPYVIDFVAQKGLEIEILNMAFAKMGFAADYLDMPLNRHRRVWQQTKLDAISAWNIAEGLECHQSLPYRHWRDALFVAANPENPKPHTPSNLQSSRIGIFRGALKALPELADENWDFQQVSEVSTLESAVRMLENGRLDAFVGDHTGISYFLQQPQERNTGGYRVSPIKFYRSLPQFLCFRDAAHAKAFDTAISGLLADPAEPLASIPRKYGIEAHFLLPFDPNNPTPQQP